MGTIDTPDGADKYTIGKIAGKLTGIHEDVKWMRGNMVTKEACVLAHERIEADMAELEDRLPKEVTGVTQIPQIPQLDIWAWAGKRIPVLLGLGALLAFGFAIWSSLNTASTRSTAIEQKLQQLVSRPAPAPVPLPIHHPTLIPTPDATAPVKHRRRRGR